MTWTAATGGRRHRSPAPPPPPAACRPRPKACVLPPPCPPPSLHARPLAHAPQDLGTVHCNINPETVIVTKDGSYKLAGFQFAAPADTGLPTAPGAAVAQPFGFPSSQPASWEEVVVVSAGPSEGARGGRAGGAAPRPPASAGSPTPDCIPEHPRDATCNPPATHLQPT